MKLLTDQRTQAETQRKRRRAGAISGRFGGGRAEKKTRPLE